MSGNPKNAMKRPKEIFISDDVLFGVFAFLGHFVLGMNVALVSYRHDLLVDTHFKTKKWSFGILQLRHATNGNGVAIIKFLRNGYDLERRLSIPQTSLPDNVIGFERFSISYIDQSVIEFLQRIHRLFDTNGINISIFTAPDQHNSWEIVCHQIWPLLNDNICCLSLYVSELNRLRQFSSAILCECPNLRFFHSFDLSPNLPADDSAEASSGQALTKWLHTPRKDGLPKMLKFVFCWSFMINLKEEFVNSSDRVNYIMNCSRADIEPFRLKNYFTGEQLVWHYFENDSGLLVRCPIGQDDDQCAKWEKEAIEWDINFNRISILFNDSDIGDGLSTANE